jgi:hypothetical protein
MTTCEPSAAAPALVAPVAPWPGLVGRPSQRRRRPEQAILLERARRGRCPVASNAPRLTATWAGWEAGANYDMTKLFGIDHLLDFLGRWTAAPRSTPRGDAGRR